MVGVHKVLMRLPLAGVGSRTEGPTALDLLRWISAACFSSTVAYTWVLWSDRSYPLTAPLMEGLPSVSMGVPMMAALVLVLVKPRVGVCVAAACFVVAVAMDQRRLQPEFVSLLVIMAATLGGWSRPIDGGLRLLGQAHLVSLWAWAGFNKVLSAGWPAVGDHLADLAGVPAMGSAFVWLVPAVEMGTAALVLWGRTRPLGIALAVVMHAGILAVLAPGGSGGAVNIAIWPWNIALGAGAVVLFSDRLDPRPYSRSIIPTPVLVGAAVFLLQPAFFYVGIGDAYLAHHLYTGNLRSVSVCDPAGVCRIDLTDGGGTNVPIPPQPRIFRSLFDQTCAPGDRLIIREPNLRVGPFDRGVESERECPRSNGPTSGVVPVVIPTTIPEEALVAPSTTQIPVPSEGSPALMIAPNGMVVPVLDGEEGAWIAQTPCGSEIELGEGDPVHEVDVVIDPGHGGVEEPGAVGARGLEEADLNLDVAERLSHWLEVHGRSSVQVRTGDYFMRIPERAAVVNAVQPTVFVSIHHNGGPAPEVAEAGVQTFHQFEQPDSTRLAGLIHEELVAVFAEYEDIEWVGVFPGPQHMLNTSGGDFYGVLRRTPDTVSVLVEALWLSNPDEALLLWDQSVRQAEAEAIGRAIVRFLDTEEQGTATTGGVTAEGPFSTESDAPCVDPDLTELPPFASVPRWTIDELTAAADD